MMKNVEESGTQLSGKHNMPPIQESQLGKRSVKQKKEEKQRNSSKTSGEHSSDSSLSFDG